MFSYSKVVQLQNLTKENEACSSTEYAQKKLKSRAWAYIQLTAMKMKNLGPCKGK